MIFDVINLIGTTIQLMMGLVAIYVLVMFLPLFIQVFLNLLLSMVRAQFKMDLRPLVDLVFLPGSILRMACVWLVLKYHGFEFRMGFNMPDAGESASSVNRRYRGPSYYAFVDNKERQLITPVKLAFQLSLASYAMMPVFLIMILNYPAMAAFFLLVLPSNMAIPFANYLLLTIGLGGLPVPEESMMVLYAVIYQHPQLIIGGFLAILGTIIIGPYVGAGLAITFLMMSIVAMLLIQYYYGGLTMEEEPDYELRLEREDLDKLRALRMAQQQELVN